MTWVKVCLHLFANYWHCPHSNNHVTNFVATWTTMSTYRLNYVHIALPIKLVFGTAHKIAHGYVTAIAKAVLCKTRLTVKGLNTFVWKCAALPWLWDLLHQMHWTFFVREFVWVLCGPRPDWVSALLAEEKRRTWRWKSNAPSILPPRVVCLQVKQGYHTCSLLSSLCSCI